MFEEHRKNQEDYVFIFADLETDLNTSAIVFLVTRQ